MTWPRSCVSTPRAAGPAAVIDAVGMEAHGAPVGKLAQRLAGFLPDAVAQKAIETAGIDRLSALHLGIELVRRGGTVSLSGVYGGAASPMPLIQMFDKQITMRMGQANVRRWVDDLMPLVTADDDPLGVEDFATHRVPLEEAPHAYEIFQKKQDGAFKILLQPLVNLSGETILVTGANRGIGRAIVEELAKRDVRVLAGMRDPARFEPSRRGPPWR